MYTSTTEQIQSPHSHTFVGICVDAQGNCYAAERKGMRKTKAKGVVAFYPNPFINDGPPKLLYRTSTEALVNLFRDNEGHLHAVGKKRIHDNLSGKWKTKKVGCNLTQIWGVEETMFLRFYSTAPATTLLKKEDGNFIPTDIPFQETLTAIAGVRSDAIFVSGDEGIAFFNGQEWHILKDAPRHGHLLNLENDQWLTTGFRDNQTHLWRFDKSGSFEPVVKSRDCDLGPGRRFSMMVNAVDGIYLVVTHGVQRGLWKLEGTQVKRVMVAQGYCDALAGNDKVLWVSNGIELLCTNGQDWIQVRRIALS